MKKHLSILLIASGLLMSSVAANAAFPVAEKPAETTVVNKKTNRTHKSSKNTASSKVNYVPVETIHSSDIDAETTVVSSETHSKEIKKNQSKSKMAAGDNQLVALLLAVFLGGLGVHRFYLGYTWQGVVQLLTAGGFGIWWIIDVVRIAIGDLQPKDGSYGTTL